MIKIPLIVIGLVLSVGTALWWNSELAGMLGDRVGSQSFRCLIRIGTGDCQQLWFAGMHATNQIAGIVFYIGLLMAGFGLFMPGQNRRDDDNEFVERPNFPPHL
jgi:hypothetical protein